MTNFILNPMVRFQWISDKKLNKRQFVIDNVLNGEDKYILEDFDFIKIINEFLVTNSKHNLLSQFENSIAKEKLNDIWEFLVETEILVLEDSDLIFKTKKWFEKYWRVAMYFHFATRNIHFLDKGEKEYTNEVKINTLSNYPEDIPQFYLDFSHAEIINLPSPQELNDVSLSEVLINRKTSRKFNKVFLKIEELSSILFFTFKEAKEIRDFASQNYINDFKKLLLSTYTPVEMFCVVLRVQDLDPGIYRYSIKDHGLILIKAGFFDELITEIAIGQNLHDTSIVFLFTSVFERYQWRYRTSRAFKNLINDIAALVSRLILICTNLEIKTFLTPAIRDTLADSALNLEKFSLDETTIYLVGVGK